MSSANSGRFELYLRENEGVRLEEGHGRRVQSDRNFCSDLELD